MSVELFALALAAKALICHDDLSKIVGTAIDGTVGNRADDLVRSLAAKMGEGAIPANHHVRQAGQTALRETVKLLVSGVAAEMGDKPPLWDALQRHLRAGTLTDRPLIHFRDFPEYEWLEKLQALAEDERALKDLRRRLPFDEISVIAALRSDAEAEQAGRRFDETLAAWLKEHLQEETRERGQLARQTDPARCLDDFLANGFPLEKGGRERVRPFQAWRLIFAEAAKTTPEIFNILVLRTLADLSGRNASALPDRQDFQQALAVPVAFIRSALERIEGKIDGLHDKVDEVKELNNEILAAIQQSNQTYRYGGLHQLKSPPEHFTGRAEQLARLVQALRSQAAGPTHADRHTGMDRRYPGCMDASMPSHPWNLDSGDPCRNDDTPTYPHSHTQAENGILISAINGMGGIGKTALALMAAHAVLDDFPDLQLFIELGAHSLRPVSAEDARDSVLRAAEPTRPLPTTPDGYLDQAACWRLYRELFHGRRALVLLDDAANDAQVEKLAPPTGCALLVTSRHRLRLRHALHLERLPPAEAAELLQRLAPRLTATEAQELAELCVGLPVALRIAGGYLNAHAATPAAEYLHALQTNRLRRLRDKALQNDSDTHHDVNLVFEHSYTQLDAAQQQAWTALSVMSASFDRDAGKALIAAVVSDTDGAADSNADLSQQHRHSGRDAGIQAKDGNSSITQEPDSDNVAAHSLPSIVAGFRHPCRNDEIKRIATAQQEDDYDPGDLLDSLEQLNLLDYNPTTQRFDWHDPLRDYAATKADPQLTQAARDAHACHYAAVAQQTDKLYMQGHDDILQGLALFDREREQLEAAFAHLQTRPELAQILLELIDGVTHTSRLRFHPQQQIIWLERQIRAARQMENRTLEGYALGNSGLAYADFGEMHKAIECYEQHLTIAHEMSDQRGEGNALGNLGNANFFLGKPRKAIEYQEKRLTIVRDIGDRLGESQTLGNLGLVYAHLGNPHKAIEYFERNLAIAQEIGNRYGEGAALSNLGMAYANVKESSKAIECFKQVLSIFHSLGDRRGEGAILGNLGAAYRLLGEPSKAIEYQEQRLTIVREIGDRRGESEALSNLGNAHFILGKLDKAIHYYEQALTIARDIGDRRGEGNALWNAALAYKALGEREQALPRAEQALAIYEAIEDPNAAKVRATLAEWRNT